MLRGVQSQLIALVLIVLIPTSGLVIYVAIQQRQAASKQAIAESLRLSRLVQAEHERVISETEILLSTLGSLPQVRSLDRDRCDELLAGLVARDGTYLNLGTADTHGDVNCSALPLPQPVNIADRAYFRRAIESGSFAIGEYQIGRITGRPSVNASFPIVGADHGLSGIVYAAIDLQAFGRLATRLGLPAGWDVSMIGADGTVLSRWPEQTDAVGNRAPTDLFEALSGAAAAEGTFRAVGLDGVDRFYSFRVIASNGGERLAYIVTGVPSSLVFAAANRSLAVNLAVLAAVTSTSLVLARLIGHRNIIQPVRSLLGASQQLERGDFSARATFASRVGELGTLGRSFNHMAASIEVQKAQLEDVNRQLRTILEGAGEGICGLDQSGRITFINPAGARILGYDVSELTAKHMHEVVHHSRPDGKPYPARLCPIGFTLREGLVREAQDDAFWHKSGRPIPVSWTSTPIAGSPRRFGAVVVFKDEAERRRLEDDLKRLSTIDALTELPNKQAFTILIQQAVEIARAGSAKGALIMIDLDNFRYVNDAYGYSVGDQLVRAVAEPIGTKVPLGGAAARLGGDQFAVIAPQLSPVDAIRFAQSIIGEIAEVTVRAREERIRVTASAGVTMFPNGKGSGEDFMVQAEIAVHRAKLGGRNRVVLFDPEAREREDRTIVQRTRTEIAEALDENRFLLYLQPIVRISDRTVESYEALVRLRARDGSIQPPSSFIPQAEEVDLIASIDRRVVELAFVQWRTSADAGKPIRVSINLSTRTISPNLADFIVRAAHSQRLPFPNVVFEITETAAQRGGPVVAEFTRRIRDVGFGLALDDYGSGATSFQEIRSGRFTQLKLDGSLIKRLESDVTDRVFVRSITSVAKAHGLVVVAEHVDDRTLPYVADAGVDLAQGYSLGMPLPWGNGFPV